MLLGDHVTSARLVRREKRFHFSAGLGFGIGLGLWYDFGYWLGFGSEIRNQGL